MSKLINISDETYRKLTELKGKESYTEAIKKLLERKGNKEAILSFAGKIKFDDEKIKDLKQGWKRWSDRYV